MIRPPNLPADLVTVDEFRALVEDDQKADLIDGVIYMASPDTLRNNRLNMFVFFLMDGYVTAKQLAGLVVAGRYAFELSEIRAPEPDVAYIGPQRAHLADERGMKGGPDIAVEVVSRDSRTRDYLEKKQRYLEAGVPEYWIIDPLARRRIPAARRRPLRTNSAGAEPHFQQPRAAGLLARCGMAACRAAGERLQVLAGDIAVVVRQRPVGPARVERCDHGKPITALPTADNRVRRAL